MHANCLQEDLYEGVTPLDVLAIPGGPSGSRTAGQVSQERAARATREFFPSLGDALFERALGHYEASSVDDPVNVVVDMKLLQHFFVRLERLS